MKQLLLAAIMIILSGCSAKYDKTVGKVDREKFMGDWYVMAGRFTALETDVYNSIETYIWNEKENRIDVDFRYNKGGFDGPLKKHPQKAWIVSEDNSRWKVQPFWPLKFDYLIIGLDPDYRWTAIGVPSEKYLWIMSRDPKFSRNEIDQVLKILEKSGYNTSDIEFVQHKYTK